jgi:hypothetical protein
MAAGNGQRVGARRAMGGQHLELLAKTKSFRSIPLVE